MVRKEVAILTKLNHRNLTQLCGIFINPIMMLTELAPMGSLSKVLKEYKAANALVVPSVLRASIYQVCNLSVLHYGIIAMYHFRLHLEWIFCTISTLSTMTWRQIMYWFGNTHCQTLCCISTLNIHPFYWKSLIMVSAEFTVRLITLYAISLSMEHQDILLQKCYLALQSLTCNLKRLYM